MSAIPLAQRQGLRASDFLASLILRQISQREEAMPGSALAEAARPARARAWRALASKLWKLRTDPAPLDPPGDCLPWSPQRLAQLTLERAGMVLAAPRPERTFEGFPPRPQGTHGTAGGRSGSASLRGSVQ